MCDYNYEHFSFPVDRLFTCDEPPITNSNFCIFHDKDHYTDHRQKATKRFEEKLKESISKDKPLECSGYYLPYINFPKLLQEKSFVQAVYFNESTFYERTNFNNVLFLKGANFTGTLFKEEVKFIGAEFKQDVTFRGAKFSKGALFIGTNLKWANFSDATFYEEAEFDIAEFYEQAWFTGAAFRAGAAFKNNKFVGDTYFRGTSFEEPNKIVFDNNNLSNVIFADSDITRITFSDNIRWGGEDEFTVIEEEWIERKVQPKNDFFGLLESQIQDASLELVLPVYRNLRENYEFKLRYDDAGKFFIKEMELKRNYRYISSKLDLGGGSQTTGGSGSSDTSSSTPSDSGSSTFSSSGSSRCPNGYHRSPSGDCEIVTDTRGMPRCPNGYHRSPDGDCEYVG